MAKKTVKKKTPKRAPKGTQTKKGNPDILVDFKMPKEARAQWAQDLEKAKARGKKEGRKLKITPMKTGIKISMKKKRAPSPWILFVKKKGSIGEAVEAKNRGEFEAFKKKFKK